MKSDLVIIPDVHGRDFWKECVSDLSDETVVFLGDYLDPYPEFGITREHALENFKEIIEYKKSHPSNTVLLLGNHDFSRYIYADMYNDRVDRSHISEISRMFFDNRKLFQIGYWTQIGEITYTFTHAGFSKKWVDLFGGYFEDSENPVSVLEGLNGMYENEHCGLPNMLDYCSRYRGGWSWCGSVVWSDVREIDTENPQWPNTFEVFAHTRMAGPALCGTFLCCDCGQGFRLNSEGQFFYMNGEPVEILED